MTARRPVDAAAPVDDLAGVLAGWQPAYQRWWEQRWHRADAVVPWSALDQTRLDQLVAADPDSLSAAAERLGEVAAALHDLGRAVGELGARGGLGTGIADRCTELAAMIGDRADETDGLARDLRALGARLEHLLAVLVSHLARAAQSIGAAGWDDQSGAAGGEGEGPEAGWPALDELVDRHARGLAPLRAVLAGAAAGGCAAPPHPASAELDGGCAVPMNVASPDTAATGGWYSDRTELDIWCPARDEAAGRRSEADEWATWYSPADESGAARWGSEPPSTPAPVVADGDTDRVWRVWRPLSTSREGAGPERDGVRWPVAPGDGPIMPGTEGRRPGTDLGVRIAELPDRPGIRRGR